MPTQGSAALDFNDQAGSVDCLDHLASADDALQFLLHAKRLFAFLIAGTKTQLTSSSSPPQQARKVRETVRATYCRTGGKASYLTRSVEDAQDLRQIIQRLARDALTSGGSVGMRVCSRGRDVIR